MQNKNKYPSLSDIFLYNVFGHLTTVIICIFSYDIYILLDQYFHTIIFSILVGASMKPIKNMIVNDIVDLLYAQNLETSKQYSIFQIGMRSLILETVQQLPNQSQAQKYSSKEQQTKKIDISWIMQSEQSKSNQGQKAQSNKKLKKKKSEFKMIKNEIKIQQKKKQQNRPKKQKEIIKFIKMLINILAIFGIMFFLKKLIGLNLVLLMIFGYLLIYGKLAKRILNIIIEFKIIKKIITLFQFKVSKQRFQKSLSSLCSVVCIISIILLIVMSTIFCIYMIQTDIRNVQKSLNQSQFKTKIIQITQNINFQQLFNNTIFKNIQTLDYYQQIRKLFQGNTKQIKNNSTADCQYYINSYLPSYIPIPQFVKTTGCSLYSELQMNTINKYLSYLKQLFQILNNFIGFSFGQIFGVVNYLLLFMFKTFIFFTVTFYILQEFNVELFLKKIGTLFTKQSDTSTSKISVSFAAQFLSELKTIMGSSLYIGLMHFLLSWITLQLFQLTPFNFVMSILFGVMAMLPIYQPYIGAGVLSVFSYYINKFQDITTPFIFFVIYFLASNKIFTQAYKQIKIPVSITNLSVILGIYSYGIQGVFYGPLIIVIMKRIINVFQNN